MPSNDPFDLDIRVSTTGGQPSADSFRTITCRSICTCTCRVTCLCTFTGGCSFAVSASEE